MGAVALAKVWQRVWPTSGKAFACPGRATPAGHSAAVLLGALEGTGVGCSQAPLQRVTEPPRPPAGADRGSPPDGLRPDPLIVL